MGSVLLDCARGPAVPAGGALASTASSFPSSSAARLPPAPISRSFTVRSPIFPRAMWLSPLACCWPGLSEEVMKLVGGDALAFFWTPPPRLSMPLRSIWTCCSRSRATRSRGVATTSRCPAQQGRVRTLHEALTTADRVVLKDFEGGDLFVASLPREVARTGKDAIRFGAR